MAAAAVAAAGLVACEPDGATLTVTTELDGADVLPGDGICEVTAGTGDCSLRAAIDEANALNGHERIVIAPGIDPVLTLAGTDDDTNATGDLDITGSTTIEGAGATVDAAGLDRAIDIHPATGTPWINLRDLVIINGAASDGGAARIAEPATLAIRSSTLSNSHATGSGGAVWIAPHATLIATNTTISGNTATAAGSAVANTGTADLSWATITDNSGPEALHNDPASTGPFNIGATIVAEQASGLDCSGTITSSGTNLQSADTCGTAATAHGTTLLAPLADNGGLTPTHLPLPGSDAIDAVSPADGCGVASTDQRGMARPAGGACDVGATETTTTAEPLAIGTAAHVGNDPDTGASASFWLNTAAPATSKHNGDRFHAAACSGVYLGCPGSGAGRNAEYRPEGYLFRTTVEAITPDEPLSIQVYDPAFTSVDDTCETNMPGPDQIAILVDAYGGPEARYQPGGSQSANQFCTGDMDLVDSRVVTTYIVRAPDDTPSDDLDNPAICAVSFSPYDTNTWDLLDPAGSYRGIANLGPRGREEVPFWTHFHRWFTVCEVPPADVQTGDYIIQVRTNADLGSPNYSRSADLPADTGAGSLEDAATPIPTTGGTNRYGLRAGWGRCSGGAAPWYSCGPSTPNPGTRTAGLTVTASSAMSLYLNMTDVASLPVAAIGPDAAGATLQLTYWDVDWRFDALSVTILPPPDATGTSPECTFARPGLVLAGTATGCTLHGMSWSSYASKLLVVSIPIPADYDCDVDDPLLDCRFTTEIHGTGLVADTTTWTATLIRPEP